MNATTTTVKTVETDNFREVRKVLFKALKAMDEGKTLIVFHTVTEMMDAVCKYCKPQDIFHEQTLQEWADEYYPPIVKEEEEV